MNSLLQAIVNVAGLLPALTSLMVFVSFLSGVWFFIRAMIALARPSNSGNQVDTGYVTTHVVVGVCLISLGAVIYNMTETFFGTGQVSSASEIFSYAQSTVGFIHDPTTRTVITSIVGIVQFVGLLAIIRGLFMFAAYSKQTVRTVGPAITFLISGVLAMNFPRVVGAFSALFS